MLTETENRTSRIGEAIQGQEVKSLGGVRIPAGIKNALEMLNLSKDLEKNKKNSFNQFFIELILTHPHVKQAFRKNPEWFQVKK